MRTGGGLDKFAAVTHCRGSIKQAPDRAPPCQRVPELKPEVGPLAESGATPSDAPAKERVSKKQLDEAAHQEMLATLHQPDAPFAGVRPLSRQPSHRVPKPNLEAGERPFRANKFLLVTEPRKDAPDYVPSALVRKPPQLDPKAAPWPAARAVDDPDAKILRTGGIHKNYTADKALRSCNPNPNPESANPHLSL